MNPKEVRGSKKGYLEVCINNTRRELLVLIKELLASHGIRANIHRHGNEWELGIYGDNAWRFLLKIKPRIKTLRYVGVR